MEALGLFAAPFAMCLVLAGMHCYLGLHVLARGIIFVDLSLAQVAALGYTLAVLMGWPAASSASYALALGLAFLAAGIFARARRMEKILSLEALIGVVYALGSAALVLASARMAHGAEEVRDLLVGQVLWVTWADVAKTAAIYAAVGAAHWAWRAPLIEASFGRGGKRGLWDFVFYGLFSIVITSSVRFAGVLQVFAYLVVPAMLGQLFFRSLRARLLFGWGLGAAVSVLGLALSYWMDLPSGAMIVVLFSLLPVAAVIAGKRPG
jgi:zinc/manganese transport system permease protein